MAPPVLDGVSEKVRDAATRAARWARAATRGLARLPWRHRQRTLAALFECWLATRRGDLHESTIRMHARHGRTLAERLPPLRRLDEAAVDRFVDGRLQEVQRATVLKELSTLRQALRWAEREGWIRRAPQVRPPPPHRRGVVRRRHRPQWPRQTEVEALLAELPERTPRGAEPRAWYTLMWETGLRRGTLRRLRVEHWDPERGLLLVPAEADKARFERELPVSRRAAGVLDELARTRPRNERLFPRPPCRHTLRAAVRRAGLPPPLAAHLSDHDLRRGRATEWLAGGGSLAGVGYLLGHLQVSTTDRYARPLAAAARAVLAATDPNAPTVDRAADSG